MTSPRLLNQEDYVRRSQQQHGANPLYETSAPSPYTPHSASSVVALHQEHLAGLYSYPLQQPYFNPHSLATAQQFQPQNSTDLTALLNQSSAILDRLENWEKVVQHRTSRKTPSTSADELSQQGLPQQNDDASPTSGAASPTSPRQTNTAGADSGLSNPSGTTGDEEETAFLETQDAIANIPHGIRRKVENYVRQLEDQLRALRKEDKESSDDLYTEEDLLLTAKFYQFRETDLAGIASRSRQSVRRWNPWNAYYKKHYPTTSIAHIPEDELKAIQPANPTPQWFELTAAKRMQMQIMMAKNSILSAKFADLQKNQNTDEWKQLVAEAEEYNAKAARKWQQTNGTRLHDRDRNVLNPVREEGVRESIRKDFITYMLGWKDVLERFNYDFHVMFADPRTPFTWSTGTARGLKFQERRMRQMRCAEDDFGAFTVNHESDTLCETITTLFTLGKEKEMYQMVLESLEKDYAAAVEEEEKLRAEQERKRALAEAEKANGLTGERGQSAVPDPRDDVFKKSVGLYKLKESFRANLPSTHTPLSSKADLRADRVRKKVQASKPDGTAPSTPIRVQLQDNRLADMHTHLKHVWSQAMPGTLTATGQFPKKAREMLESNGLTWVLPTGVTVDHVYKKTKPIYVIRLLEKAMLNRQPARIVPKEAAPPETS